MEKSNVSGKDCLPEATIKPKPVDRVTLGSTESTRVSAWISQLGEASKGFLELTKSDLVNFLVREHPDALTQKEIKTIRASHYDPVRHLNWIAPRLKEALTTGDIAQVAILQNEIRGIELSVISKNANSVTENSTPRKKPRRRKSAAATVEMKSVAADKSDSESS